LQCSYLFKEHELAMITLLEVMLETPCCNHLKQLDIGCWEMPLGTVKVYLIKALRTATTWSSLESLHLEGYHIHDALLKSLGYRYDEGHPPMKELVLDMAEFPISTDCFDKEWRDMMIAGELSSLQHLSLISCTWEDGPEEADNILLLLHYSHDLRSLSFAVYGSAQARWADTNSVITGCILGYGLAGEVDISDFSPPWDLVRRFLDALAEGADNFKDLRLICRSHRVLATLASMVSQRRNWPNLSRLLVRLPPWEDENFPFFTHLGWVYEEEDDNGECKGSTSGGGGGGVLGVPGWQPEEDQDRSFPFQALMAIEWIRDCR